MSRINRSKLKALGTSTFCAILDDILCGGDSNCVLVETKRFKARFERFQEASLRERNVGNSEPRQPRSSRGKMTTDLHLDIVGSQRKRVGNSCSKCKTGEMFISLLEPSSFLYEREGKR